MALTTDRISVLRGRPPVRAGGRRGFRTAHCWLVRSLGYGFGFIPFLRSRPPFWNRLSALESGIDGARNVSWCLLSTGLVKAKKRGRRPYRVFSRERQPSVLA